VVTGGYKGLQGLSRANNRGLEGVTGAKKGLQGVTGITRAYRALEGDTSAYRGLKSVVTNIMDLAPLGKSKILQFSERRGY